MDQLITYELEAGETNINIGRDTIRDILIRRNINKLYENWSYASSNEN